MIHAQAPRMTLALRLMAEPPANGFDPLQAAKKEVEAQSNESDQQHGRYDKVIPLAGVAGIDDEISQTGIHGNHLCCDNHQPCDAESDAKSDDDLWQSCGENNAPEKLK